MSHIDGGRLRAIALPCPAGTPISPRVASLLACSVMTACYLAWSIALWGSYFQLSEIKAASGGTEYDQLVLMSRYAALTGWYAVTETCLCLGAVAVSAWPQAEMAKWLSRLIWFGWLVSWGLGIFGIVAYLSSDAFLAAGCERGEECWAIRQRLQVGLTAAVFVTLAIVFYCSIILSSFVHTLHPHIFMSPDSDSDDEYSDVEEHRAQQLEMELMRSGHPYAGEAILGLREERRALARERGTSRRRTGYYTPETDDEKLPAPAQLARELSLEKRRGSLLALARERDAEYDSDDSDDAGDSRSSDEERGQRGLMRSDAARRGRGRAPVRELSDISSSDVEGESSEEDPPAYESRGRSRQGREGELATSGRPQHAR
ncbi:hypothetical protein JCM3770_002657 [Rhodotorula araucariae]